MCPAPANSTHTETDRLSESTSICVAYLQAMLHLECNKSRNKFCWHRRVAKGRGGHLEIASVILAIVIAIAAAVIIVGLLAAVGSAVACEFCGMWKFIS